MICRSWQWLISCRRLNIAASQEWWPKFARIVNHHNCGFWISEQKNAAFAFCQISLWESTVASWKNKRALQDSVAEEIAELQQTGASWLNESTPGRNKNGQETGESKLFWSFYCLKIGFNFQMLTWNTPTSWPRHWSLTKNTSGVKQVKRQGHKGQRSHLSPRHERDCARRTSTDGLLVICSEKRRKWEAASLWSQVTQWELSLCYPQKWNTTTWKCSLWGVSILEWSGFPPFQSNNGEWARRTVNLQDKCNQLWAFLKFPQLDQTALSCLAILAAQQRSLGIHCSATQLIWSQLPTRPGKFGKLPQLQASAESLWAI